jgi:hypothetical protein
MNRNILIKYLLIVRRTPSSAPSWELLPVSPRWLPFTPLFMLKTPLNVSHVGEQGLVRSC